MFLLKYQNATSIFIQGESFKEYKARLEGLESKESLRRDFLFEREQKLIGDMAHKQKEDEHERMRRHTSNYYAKIKDQVQYSTFEIVFRVSFQPEMIKPRLDVQIVVLLIIIYTIFQIDKHKADAHYDRTVVKRREEEARLEAERKYEHR